MGGRTGKDNPRYGSHHTEETKEKIGLGNKGKVVTEETKRKLSKINSGKNNPRITKKDVILEILKLLDNGVTHIEIAKKLSIGSKIVAKVKNGWYNNIYDLPERHYSYGPKLVEKKIIIQILRLLNEGMTVIDIVKTINVSMTSVYRTKNGYYDDKYNLNEEGENNANKQEDSSQRGS